MRRLIIALAIAAALLPVPAIAQTYGQRLQGANGWLLPVASRLLGSSSQDHLSRGSVLAWDVSASVGTPIFPIAAGKVEYAGCNNAGGYGCWVYINHGDGYRAIYAHLAQGSVFVKNGQTVGQWDVIGQVGLTGMTSWPHTHLEVSRNHTRIDPAKIWNIDQMSYCKFCKSQNGPKDGITGVQMAGNVAQAQAVNRVPYGWFVGVYLALVVVYAISGYSQWAQHAIYHGLAMFTALLMFMWLGGVLPGLQGQQTAQGVQVSAVSGGDAFELAYKYTAKSEGWSCTEDGAHTFGGVTQGTYNAWRKSKGLPIVDVCGNLTEAQRKQIFAERYWQAFGGDKLPGALAITYIDHVFVTGSGSRGLAQCGTDVKCFNDWRIKDFQSKSNCFLYCRGWINRVNRFRTITEG